MIREPSEALTEYCRCGAQWLEDLTFRRDAEHAKIGKRLFRCLSGHTRYLDLTQPTTPRVAPVFMPAAVVLVAGSKLCAACQQAFQPKHQRMKVCLRCRRSRCKTCRKVGGFHRASCPVAAL